MTVAVKRAIRRIDTAVGRRLGPRRVLVDARTPMNFGILAPVCRALRSDARVDVVFTADRPDEFASAAATDADFDIRPRHSLKWRRVDLCLSADPWDPIELRRCHRRANFFHGVAGKYDLDAPMNLPAGFGDFDRVAFVNADRMEKYLAAGIVTPREAVLVGYPKVDALANGCYDAVAVRAGLRLEPGRRTAMYTPTWSPASSLNLAGEAIVRNLLDAGLNVIVKLHDRSLDRTNVKYSGGVDWRARFAAIDAPGRLAFVEAADSSPLLAASDAMITDHSSIGFEFCLLDRPLIVFDAPDLLHAARINPEKMALLRSAARVVRTAEDIAGAVTEEIEHPARFSAARRALVREMFHRPGSATPRALAMIYDLLDLPVPTPHRLPSYDTRIAESAL